MKINYFILCLEIFCSCSSAFSQVLNYSQSWERINDLESQGLPKSALMLTDSLFHQAQQEQNYTQFVKAFMYKMKFRASIKDNALVNSIMEVEKVADSASFPVKPILHSMVAEMYWWYFEKHRYEFYNRSRTSQIVSSDISTWDLYHLIDKVIYHYKASLADSSALKQLPLKDFNNILFIVNKDTDAIRPTLYDFLAMRAIDFFSEQESSLIHPENEFSINNADFFLPADQFSRLTIRTPDTSSFNFNAIRLYQDLIKFHLNDSTPEALADIDLKRIKFIDALSTNEEKDSLYLNALQYLENKCAGHRCAAGIGMEIAERLYETGSLYDPHISQAHRHDIDEAVQKCLAIKKEYPFMDKACNSFIEKVNAKSVSLVVEKENIPDQPFKALVTYKNTDKVFVNVIRTTYDKLDSYLKKYDKQNSAAYMDWDNFIIPILKEHKALLQYSVSLPTDNDYQEHTAEIKIPALDHGLYIILAGTRKDFDVVSNEVAYGLTDVTYLSYISKRESDGSNTFCILNRKTGEPIAGADVECWANSYSYSGRKDDVVLKATRVTDDHGFVKFTTYECKNRNYWLNITYNGDHWNTGDISRFYKGSYFYNYSIEENKRKEIHTYFFTDRSIYRPGQTIYFKGIVLETDKHNNNKILKGYTTHVLFRNVNYQEIASLDVTTNDFGSFSGSFTAPSNGLNGRMVISDGYHGSIAVNVEDYKRPKFEVKFDTLQDSYKLGQTVNMKGSAVAYSGAQITGATVKYRVVRRARFYPWYYWWMPNTGSDEKEITHGTCTTDDNGNFRISFKAVPDAGVQTSNLSCFMYTVYADVTDINGETHSTQKSIFAGYKALLLGIDLPQKIEKNTSTGEFKISTTNLNGDFVPASGTIKIERLKGPERVLSRRLWAAPDKFAMPEDEFRKNFPTSPYADDLNPETWKTEEIVLQTKFDTHVEKHLELSGLPEWPEGMYRATIQSTDKYGEKVEKSIYFILFDQESHTLPYAQANWYDVTNSTCEPGDSAKIVFGSAFDKFHVLIEVESKNQIIERKWMNLKKGQYRYSFPITEKYRGNIGIHLTFVVDNRMYANNSTITVPYTNKKLDIQFETFRDKLQPGEKEQWKIKINDKYGEKVAAEMVATLYDASLDALKPNSFNFNILPTYVPSLAWNAYNEFNTNYLRSYTQLEEKTFSMRQNAYFLNWFDLDSLINGGYYYNSYKRYQDFLKSKVSTGREVRGTVLDQSGMPLPGVSVMVQGSNTGTVTDLNGNFTLFVPAAHVLQISYIGYQTQYVTVKNSRSLKINLTEDLQSLEEVVVVGYGVQSMSNAAPTAPAPKIIEEDKTGQAIPLKIENKEGGVQPESSQKEKHDLYFVKARTNLNETAFFYPQLQTDEHGEILINFTIPEALTRWKMLGFAHTTDLKYGFTEKELVTQKDLMITPNAPRFFRENDTMIFTAKVSNLTDKKLSGDARLMLFDALTMKPVDEQMHNDNALQNFTVGKAGNTNLNWKIVIPAGLQAVTYRVVAKSGNFSDGEESSLPVLTNRILVTETMPLPIKGHQTKTFTMQKLVHPASSTIRSQKLTLEFTSNPAWYAIQALPYLMEYPYECAEQTFSRFYANSIASYIANSNPRIKAVFDSWKNITPDALLSNLEKNQELKNLLLEETPWVLNAKDESQRKRQVALLFDLNRMSNELEAAINRLSKLQVSNGGWPWFEGMPDDWYITQHIICGMGKLDHLGIRSVKEDDKVWRMVSRGINYIDNRISDDYMELKRGAKSGSLSLSDDHIGYMEIHYLYARSFFKDVYMSKDTREALDYFLGQARKYWFKNNHYMQGMIALALSRYGDNATPQKILRSLKEHAMTSDEMGMYWKNKRGWYWYQAPIETQAMMIEAFDEVGHDSSSVDEMKVWLLKQKQVQDWGTTKATVEACYALLLRGTNWLTSEDQVDIKLGDMKVDPAKIPGLKVEAGSGYFKTSWTGKDIKPEMGNVTVTKHDGGVSWGALYWQYFEQLDKITPAETPLKVKKQLFVERNTASGLVIQPISDTTRLKPGDLIKVRIELRVNRDMEYVQMKDMRAAGLEPINVLSRYKYQDGLGYYESTGDAATNFFFDGLPKGTHVFEYPLRVTHYGNFSDGITTVQCMYAPEFSSHSEGMRVIVK